MITFQQFMEKAFYGTPGDRITPQLTGDRAIKPVNIHTMEPQTPVRQPEASPHHIRWMISRDFPEIISIIFQKNPIVTPQYAEQVLSTGDVSTLLNKQIVERSDELKRTLRVRNVIGMVMEDGEKVIGYIIYELNKSTFDILRFGTRGNNLQLAEGFFSKLIGKLGDRGRNALTISVNANSLLNSPTISNWFKQIGFDSQMAGDKIQFTYKHIEKI